MKPRPRQRTLTDVINFTRHYKDGDEFRLIEKELLEDKIEDLEKRFNDEPTKENRQRYDEALKEMDYFIKDCRMVGSWIA